MRAALPQKEIALKKLLMTTVALLMTSVNAFGEMPDEYIGEWCHAEDRGQTQIYSRAPSPNCNKKIVRKLIITKVGLFAGRVICAAPRDFAEMREGTRFKADCGFDDNSSPVHTINFFIIPYLKKSLKVVID
jgi:hypothetical protein